MTFYDWQAVLAHLDAGEPAFTWIATRSVCLHGPRARHQQLLSRYAIFAQRHAERHLRTALGSFVLDSGGGIAKAARGDVTGGVTAAGRAIDVAARVCILADHQPYPYGKWLLRAAREATLGPAVTPILDSVAAAMVELCQHPVERSFREWVPIAELRRLRLVLSDELAKVGWQGAWVADLPLNIPSSSVGASVQPPDLPALGLTIRAQNAEKREP